VRALLAALEFTQLKALIAGFRFEDFSASLRGAGKQKTRSRRVIHPNPGIPGRSVQSARPHQLQTMDQEMIQYKRTYSLYGFAL
jgi:hypothetical protein